MMEYTEREVQEIRSYLAELERMEGCLSTSKAKSIRNKLRKTYGYYISELDQYSLPHSARTTAGFDRLISNGYISVIERNLKDMEQKSKLNTKSSKIICYKDSTITSFPPIVDEQSEILVLGTVPGAVSLATGEYYAQKGNIFWKVISEIFNNGVSFRSYDDKVACLRVNHIALWDVQKSCNREGSLDDMIEDEVLNDLDGFLKRYPRIRKIVFNGKKPSSYYKSVCPYFIAKSTSPANRQFTDEERIASWREALT